MTRMELIFDQELNRLAAYQYLEPWIRDQRVLELGCGQGHGLRQLFALGAGSVLGLDRDPRRCASRVVALEEVVSLRPYRPPRLGLVSGGFDLIIVNDFSTLLGPQPVLSELRSALSPEGVLVVRVESGDQPGVRGGVTYGELLDLLEPAFSDVRVFGQSHFVAYSLVELTEAASGTGEELDLSLDGALMGGAVEEVGAYLVLCGGPSVVRRPSGYGIVQVPSEGDAALERWWDSLAQEDSEPVEDIEVHARAEPGDVHHMQRDPMTETAPGDAAGGGLTTEPPTVASDHSIGRQPSKVVSTDHPNRPDLPPERPSLESLTDGGGGLLARWQWP